MYAKTVGALDIDMQVDSLVMLTSIENRLEELIEQEENKTTRGALSRCLDGLRSQAISSNALASKDVLSEASLTEMRFLQYRILFGNGVDPFRLKVLCDMLHAATRFLMRRC